MPELARACLCGDGRRGYLVKCYDGTAGCNGWFHLSCCGISGKDKPRIEQAQISTFCSLCTAALKRSREKSCVHIPVLRPADTISDASDFTASSELNASAEKEDSSSGNDDQPHCDHSLSDDELEENSIGSTFEGLARNILIHGAQGARLKPHMPQAPALRHCNSSTEENGRNERLLLTVEESIESVLQSYTSSSAVDSTAQIGPSTTNHDVAASVTAAATSSVESNIPDASVANAPPGALFGGLVGNAASWHADFELSASIRYPLTTRYRSAGGAGVGVGGPGAGAGGGGGGRRAGGGVVEHMVSGAEPFVDRLGHLRAALNKVAP